MTAIGASATALMGVGGTVAERSLAEGLTRGAFEAVAFVTGYAALGVRAA